jgi:hypothetical protein
MNIGKCKDDCNDADIKNDKFKYQPGAQGGLLRVSVDGMANIVVTAPMSADKKLTKGEVVLADCGKVKTEAADKKNCDELINARFELYPMFQMEPNKKAVNCSPYSHSHTKPMKCETQLDAQALCAQNKKCLAYNWVDASAEGDEKDLVWLCYEIHDVHLKTEKDALVGWELGIRLGYSEDLIEEVKTKSTSALLE